MTKPNSYPTFGSDKLTALLSDREKMKALSKQKRDEVWRFTGMINPQFNEVSVLRIANVAEYNKLKGGVLQRDTEQDQTIPEADIIKRALAGESIDDSVGIKELLAKAQREWTAIERAIEHLDREIAGEKNVLAKEYCKHLQPKEKELMGRVCKHMLEFHAAYSEAYDLRRHLVDTGIGLHGVCLNLPDFLSTPNNPYSEMADFFRAAKREGYIKEIPSELRL
jgi:hypothetical protein